MPVDIPVIIARVRGTVLIPHVRLFRTDISAAEHQLHFRPVFAESGTDNPDGFRALIKGKGFPLCVIRTPDFLSGKSPRQFQFLTEFFPIIRPGEIHSRFKIPEYISGMRIIFTEKCNAVFQVFSENSFRIFMHIGRTQSAVGIRRQHIGMRIFIQQFPGSDQPFEFQRTESRHSCLGRQRNPALIPGIFQVTAEGMQHGRYRRCAQPRPVVRKFSADIFHRRAYDGITGSNACLENAQRFFRQTQRRQHMEKEFLFRHGHTVSGQLPDSGSAFSGTAGQCRKVKTVKLMGKHTRASHPQHGIRKSDPVAAAARNFFFRKRIKHRFGSTVRMEPGTPEIRRTVKPQKIRQVYPQFSGFPRSVPCQQIKHSRKSFADIEFMILKLRRMHDCLRRAGLSGGKQRVQAECQKQGKDFFHQLYSFIC